MSRYRNIFFTVQKPEHVGYFITRKGSETNRMRQDLSHTLRLVKEKQQIYRNIGKIYYTSPGVTYVKGSPVKYEETRYVSTPLPTSVNAKRNYTRFDDDESTSRFRKNRKKEEEEDDEEEDEDEEEEVKKPSTFSPPKRSFSSFQQRREFSTLNHQSTLNSMRWNQQLNSKRDFSSSSLFMQENKGFFSKVKNIIKGPSKEEQGQSHL
eukprot:TRINITY_DN454_c0_g1_i2.p3 TRINITY_DN454_c0_g1~~TRINITY_DN454_c0_g1_i2.p3  ORF type:complete len:208 (-),score=99.35 TRINITY_DN454_c0_g1_i2:1586-2209(-)